MITLYSVEEFSQRLMFKRFFFCIIFHAFFSFKMALQVTTNVFNPLFYGVAVQL